ncbi:hypothetical protein QAD02_000719 [Eretmocerus hayati]|uniref:Uncharacterized protein n=1 Tax=Eretmocerus hayati TaxID=131215 RepID=A0ACC2NE30_9HYME|nr:hypothetical protein QAD02_000719 [Eretmocerus hayati]
MGTRSQACWLWLLAEADDKPMTSREPYLTTPTIPADGCRVTDTRFPPKIPGAQGDGAHAVSGHLQESAVVLGCIEKLVQDFKHGTVAERRPAPGGIDVNTLSARETTPPSGDKIWSNEKIHGEIEIEESSILEKFCATVKEAMQDEMRLITCVMQKNGTTLHGRCDLMESYLCERDGRPYTDSASLKTAEIEDMANRAAMNDSETILTVTRLTNS